MIASFRLSPSFWSTSRTAFITASIGCQPPFFFQATLFKVFLKYLSIAIQGSVKAPIARSFFVGILPNKRERSGKSPIERSLDSGSAQGKLLSKTCLRSESDRDSWGASIEAKSGLSDKIELTVCETKASSIFTTL